MPDTDLSPAVPPDAKWVKIRYAMNATQTGPELTAKLWSGPQDDAVTIKGSSGEVLIKLRHPQRLSYAKPNGIELKLKVVAYKTGPQDDTAHV